MTVRTYFKDIKSLLYIIIFLWVVHAFSYILPLNQYGIMPREISGLPGILLAPFLHADFTHLIANSVSLIILGAVLVSTGEGRSVSILFIIMLLGGLGTWIIGRKGTIHIGASGVIYGIFGYLIARGFFRRDLISIIISVVVFFMYGGMIFGVLPMVPSMSWESHLCGFVAGVITASLPVKEN